MTTWRDKAKPIISRVIAEVGYSDLKALHKALRTAYPFGPREMHPYKIWCDEVRQQTNGRLSRHGPKPKPRARRIEAKHDTATVDMFV